MNGSGTWLLFGIAVFNALTALLTYFTHQAVAATKTAIEETRGDVEVIKKATDGLTSALVKSTAEASHASGKEEERVRAEIKAAGVAEGVRQTESAAGKVFDNDKRPLPVADDRVAKASERVADVAEGKK